MSQPFDEAFDDAMWTHMQTVNKFMAEKIGALRRECLLLIRERDAARDRYYELQGENVAMQGELASRRTDRPMAASGQPEALRPDGTDNQSDVGGSAS